MEVILAKDVPNLGKVGDVVKVKPGYARNYLIPHKFAVPATAENMRQIQLEQKRLLKRREKELADIRSRVEVISGRSYTIEVEAHEDGRLYGSVTPHMIAEVIKADGFEVDPKWVILEDPIKELGIYSIEVKPHPEALAKIRLWVVAKGTVET